MNLKKLFLNLIVMLFISISAFAQFNEQTSDTATITLTGFVPVFVELQIDNVSVDNLNLTGDINQQIATAKVLGNVSYSLSVTSQNNFQFLGVTNGNPLPYILTDGTSEYTAGSLASNEPRTTSIGVDYPIYINYTADTFDVLQADIYTDVLYFSLTAD